MKTALAASRVRGHASNPTPQELSDAAAFAWQTLQSHEWDKAKWSSASRETKLQLVSIAFAQTNEFNVPAADIVGLIDQAASISLPAEAGGMQTAPPERQILAQPAAQIAPVISMRTPPRPPPMIPPTVETPSLLTGLSEIFEAERSAGQVTTDTTIDDQTPPERDFTPTSELPPCNPPPVWQSEEQRQAWMASNQHCPVPGMYVPPSPIYPLLGNRPHPVFTPGVFVAAGVGGLIGWGLCALFGRE